MLCLHIISYIVAKMVLSWDKTSAICTVFRNDFSIEFSHRFFFPPCCSQVAALFVQSWVKSRFKLLPVQSLKLSTMLLLQQLCESRKKWARYIENDARYRLMNHVVWFAVADALVHWCNRWKVSLNWQQHDSARHSQNVCFELVFDHCNLFDITRFSFLHYNHQRLAYQTRSTIRTS